MIRKLFSRIYAKFLRDLVLEDIRHHAIHSLKLMGPAEKLSIAPTAVLNNALLNTNSGTITIGDNVFFGHDVRVLTGSHDITKTGKARLDSSAVAGHDVIIESGVWIASNATIIGPCRIGRDSVVGACALVTRDVPPGTVVGGVPARKIRQL